MIKIDIFMFPVVLKWQSSVCLFFDFIALDFDKIASGWWVLKVWYQQRSRGLGWLCSRKLLVTLVTLKFAAYVPHFHLPRLRIPPKYIFHKSHILPFGRRSPETQ